MSSTPAKADELLAKIDEIARIFAETKKADPVRRRGRPGTSRGRPSSARAVEERLGNRDDVDLAGALDVDGALPRGQEGPTPRRRARGSPRRPGQCHPTAQAEHEARAPLVGQRPAGCHAVEPEAVGRAVEDLEAGLEDAGTARDSRRRGGRRCAAAPAR